VTSPAVFTEAPASVPEESSSLLPHSLYFLGIDDQGIKQIFRMERDGKTLVQLTFESANVSDYDVSMVDGSIAYEVNDQLVLSNGDGSNRRLLIEGKLDPGVPESYHPVFSPDGQTLAYGQNGLNLYNLSTGDSRLVIENQYAEPQPDGFRMPVELYWPEEFSPDGKKLLGAVTCCSMIPVPIPGALLQVQDYIYCCSFQGGPPGLPVASAHDYAYQSDGWAIDAQNGTLIRS
jgi:Tol biopolymer transport system component